MQWLAGFSSIDNLMAKEEKSPLSGKTETLAKKERRLFPKLGCLLFPEISQMGKGLRQPSLLRRKINETPGAMVLFFFLLDSATNWERSNQITRPYRSGKYHVWKNADTHTECS
ncbi:hypothetical protein CEXT_594241 [Caerostris extrusa]|uniref:Uncharacterized protein n=1 Tax=Caerostris extrusa TaxID=172846 RepID=A0AAV4VGR0_CAEEX|nr:hypothetical protein CEXT_594241 [Caerostris extrusa]